MKVYMAHSRLFDYQNELYNPLRQEPFFEKHELILPHEIKNITTNTRDFYKTIDIMIAECSHPSIGLGIELGWAFDDKKPLFILIKDGNKPSSSLFTIAKDITFYKDTKEMIEIIKDIINKNSVAL